MLDVSSHGRPDVSAELAKLKFEKRNKNLPKLPKHVHLQRRPLNHAPVASPYAGKDIQKVVYVSRKTPVMAAVKRVKKLLLHIEKRAMQGVELRQENSLKDIAVANEKLNDGGERVYVRASGRAMEQALRVAEWFRTRETEMQCNVEVSTGSVQAIDDLIEGDGTQEEETDRSLLVVHPQDLPKLHLRAPTFRRANLDLQYLIDQSRERRTERRTTITF